MPKTSVNLANAESEIPVPNLTITPAKQGYPAEGGSLDLLVRLGVGLPSEVIDRKPMALALVIDRSGSMSGAPLEAAKSAACAAIEMLLPDDLVSVVTFDSYVNVVAPLGVAGSDRSALLAAVRAIRPGGSTALYGGWAEGLSQVMASELGDTVSRVVVLSDGGANQGVSDAPSIAADVAQATTHGVTTTAMGFGRHYDEELMRSMADAGQGNYVFIEGESQVAEAFQQELSGLSALRGRNVRLEPSAGMKLSSAVTGRLTSTGAELRLPDLVGGLERDLAITATFEAGAGDPRLTLLWEDLVSETEESLEVALDIAALPADEFAALLTDPTVVSLVALARIANLKLELAQAFRGGSPREKERLLRDLGTAVEALPAGEEKDAEMRELARLREFEKTRDAAMAARYSERKARDRAFGTSDAKRMVQLRMERELHAKKMIDVHRPGEFGQEMMARQATPSNHAGTSRRTAPGPNPVGRTVAHASLAGHHGPVDVRVIVGDITEQSVDVLVNSTNRKLFGNAGVDGTVHRRGGPQLTQAARQIGSLEYGQAVFTPGFLLPARYVVHTATVPWQDGNSGEVDVLGQAYASAFSIAARLGARSLAVTALGTGSYRVPEQIAARVAFAELQQAILRGAPFSEVSFVILDPGVAKSFSAELARATAEPATARAN